MTEWGGRRAQALTAAVVLRDGGVCHLCQLPGANSADHLVPVSAGGAMWDPANLAAAHFAPCNAARGRRTLTPQLLATFRTERWRSRVVGRSPVDARSSFEGW